MKAHPDAMPGITVHDFGVDYDLLIVAQRNSERQQSAFGQNGLRVHVKAAEADVFRTRHARRIGSVEIDINDEPRTIMLTPVFGPLIRSLVKLFSHERYLPPLPKLSEHPYCTR